MVTTGSRSDGKSEPTVRRRWGIFCLVVGTAVLASPSGAQAGDLKDLLTDLYEFEGPGITLAETTHEAHFEDSFTDELNEVSSEIAAAVNLVNPGSAVASFTFDLASAVFVQSNQSLGPTVAERPQTIGQGKINFGFSYTRLDFKRLDGDKLNDLEFVLDHQETEEVGVGLDKILVDVDVDLTQDLLQFFGNYGITPKWDVGLIIPVVHTDLKVKSKAKIDRRDADTALHVFCEDAPPFFDDCESDDKKDSGSDDAWGVGDIVLRSKYHVVEAGDIAPDVGVFGFVKFNSGDEDDLLGSGHINFDAFLTAAKTFWRLTPHANAGFELTTGPSELDAFRYIAGVEAALHERVSLSGDVVGRTALDRDGFGDDIVDFAIGTKVSPWSTLTLVGTVILPLNKNEGLRTDVTWTAGVEYTF